MFLIYLLFILTISVKPILKNLAYQTDLVQIVLVGRTMSVDDQSEISFFRSFKGRCHGNQFLVVLSIELIFVTPVASGAARRINVGLWLPFSLHVKSNAFYHKFSRHYLLLQDVTTSIINFLYLLAFCYKV